MRNVCITFLTSKSSYCSLLQISSHMYVFFQDLEIIFIALRGQKRKKEGKWLHVSPCLILIYMFPYGSLWPLIKVFFHLWNKKNHNLIREMAFSRLEKSMETYMNNSFLRNVSRGFKWSFLWLDSEKSTCMETRRKH